MLISIIMPVYNVGEFIRESLDSVLGQTFQNIELIIINDGSTDNTGKIISEYTGKYKKIKYFDKSNEGVSSARNFGIKQAKGDYILFLDGDDWIDIDLLSKLVEYNNGANADVVLFDHYVEYPNKKLKKDILPEAFSRSPNIYDCVYHRFFGLLDQELYMPLESERLNTVWGKLYKAEIVKKIAFIDVNRIGGEDTWFNINALYNSRIAYCKGVYYHYRKNNSHSITRNFDINIYKKFFLLYRLIYSFIISNNLSDKYINALNNRIILNLFSFIMLIANANMSMSLKFRNLKNLLNNKIYRKAFAPFKINNLPFVWRPFYFACKYSLKYFILLFVVLIRFLKRMML